jgi:hypothetical protein
MVSKTTVLYPLHRHPDDQWQYSDFQHFLILPNFHKSPLLAPICNRCAIQQNGILVHSNLKDFKPTSESGNTKINKLFCRQTKGFTPLNSNSGAQKKIRLQLNNPLNPAPYATFIRFQQSGISSIPD